MEGFLLRSNMSYLRLAEGLNKYSLVQANNIYDLLNGFIDVEKPSYVSIYKYNDKHYESYKKNKTISGITDVTTNDLVFDLDSKTDLNQAKNDSIEVCNRLMAKNISPEDIQVYFSGSKGFHVIVTTNSELTVDKFKLYTRTIASGLTTFDKSVSDPSRILRVPFTKHDKTKRYKTPFTVEELKTLTIEEILDISACPQDDRTELFMSWKGKSVNLPIEITNIKETKPERNKVVKMEHDLDMSKKPSWMSEAKYALQMGFFEQGERNKACMILASTYKNQGFPEEITYRILKGTLERRAERLQLDEAYNKEELWENIIKIVYSPNWKGGQYSYEKEPLLQDVTARLDLTPPGANVETMGITGMLNTYSSFARDIEKNTIKLGVPTLDQTVTITTSMLVGLVAPPSSGKTSVSFDFLKTASSNGIKSVFFSMDMGQPLVFQRLVQKETGYYSQKVINMFKNPTGEEKRVIEQLDQAYKNVSFCFKSGLTVDDIRNIVKEDDERTGEKTRLIIIDYLECISSQFSDSTASSAYISQKLKDLANEYECTVLLLLQPQKIAGDPRDEINSYVKIKGSSAIQQACSVIMSINRPGFDPRHPEDDRYMSISILKNRMGQLGQMDFAWDGVRGIITELDEEGVRHLKAIREENLRERQGNDL